MTDEERKAANAFIKDYIVRKQAQDDWDPSNEIDLMRVGFEGGLEYERAQFKTLQSRIEEIMVKGTHRIKGATFADQVWMLETFQELVNEIDHD